MKILVTGSRLPVALETIRKLGRSGHRVDACDSFWSAPGNHSRHVAASFVTASPRDDTERFLEDVVRIVRTREIERLLPSFEEVFYLSRLSAREELGAVLFAPPFATLALLHDKGRLAGLASALGVRVAPTIVASDADELARACRAFPRFFARPCFTRGSVALFTNAGPRAGAMRLEDCRPTPESPYVVQPFLEGREVCTYGIAHRGRLAAHVAYAHPLQRAHAPAMSFESVVSDEARTVVARLVEHTRYHGQISLDFLATAEGLFLVECNPRPSAGLALMPDAMFDEALLDRHPDTTLVAPAGVRRHLSLALLRDLVAHPSSLRASLTALTSGTLDACADARDRRPLLAQWLAAACIVDPRARAPGYVADLIWDGDRAALPLRLVASGRGAAPGGSRTPTVPPRPAPSWRRSATPR